MVRPAALFGFEDVFGTFSEAAGSFSCFFEMLVAVLVSGVLCGLYEDFGVCISGSSGDAVLKLFSKTGTDGSL